MTDIKDGHILSDMGGRKIDNWRGVLDAFIKFFRNMVKFNL